MNNSIKLKWGIVGLGSIANKFAKDLQLVEGAELTAVASRSKENALSFAAQYGVDKGYGTYKEIFEDEEVDIIYIATPHNSHASIGIEAMNHGKHVLCEKPLAVNASQVEDMITAARENKVFLMEAFWSRFNPSIEKVLELINDKEVGKINYVNADFCFYGMDSVKSRVLSMDLAGGALLDIGVYPVFLSYVIFGVPEEIKASSIFHQGGADIQTAAILKYQNGLANLTCGFNSNSDMTARIYGDNGSIFIDDQWHHAQGYSVVKDGISNHYSLPVQGTGFTFEIEECKSCILSGKIESLKWSWRNSLELIKICDEIREQVGLKYPFES